MLTGREVVKLNAEISVVRAGKAVENDSHQGDIQNDGGSGGERGRLATLP
jgi:hypothetical protein